MEKNLLKTVTLTDDAKRLEACREVCRLADLYKSLFNGEDSASREADSTSEANKEHLLASCTVFTKRFKEF